MQTKSVKPAKNITQQKENVKVPVLQNYLIDNIIDYNKNTTCFIKITLMYKKHQETSKNITRRRFIAQITIFHPTFVQHI